MNTHAHTYIILHIHICAT